MPDDSIDRGPPVLSAGLRPFFLVAGAYAVLAMLAWILWLAVHSLNAVVVSPTIAVAAHLWHGHEMLFGYGAAAASGFLLTAVPNWTNTRPVTGTPLLVLVAVWLTGRLAMWFSSLLPATVVALADMAHLPLLTVFVAVALFRRPAARNLIFLAVLAFLIAANGAIHAEWIGLTDDTASSGLALAVMTFTLLIVIIGGRVVPAFTRNALLRGGEKRRLPESFRSVEVASIVSVAALVALTAADGPEFATGWLALVAAAANAVRIASWRTAATLRQPILWSLHLAYGFVVLGLVAAGVSRLTDMFSQTAAMHILAIGAIGGMTLAMMTRAALGHTQRALKVGRLVAVSYALVGLAALVRGFGLALFPQDYYAVIFSAGALWVAGFSIFTVVYAPILIGPSRPEGPAN